MRTSALAVLALAALAATVFADDAATTNPAAASAIHETFDGVANAKLESSNFSLLKTAGNMTAKLDGKGAVVLNTVVKNPSHRAYLLTKSTSVDPFAAPVTIALNDLALAGEPTAEGGYVSAFVLLGRAEGDDENKFYPDGGDVAHGLSVQVRKDKAGKYDVRVDEFSDAAGGDGTATTNAFPLAAAPTGITVTIDGAKKTAEVAVAGTTFSELNAATASVTLGEDFTREHLSDGGTLKSRVSVGALNGGATKAGTQVTIGDLEVK